MLWLKRSVIVVEIGKVSQVEAVECSIVGRNASVAVSDNKLKAIIMSINESKHAYG